MTTTGWDDSQDAQRYAVDLLRGERVRLRELRETDLPTLVAWWNDPEWAVLQQKRVKPRPGQSVSEMFSSWSDNKPGNADVGFSIVSADDGTLLGHTTLYGASPTTRASEFAILLGPDHIGRGLGSEATRLVIGYGFRELGLNRIGLAVWAYNSPRVFALPHCLKRAA